MKLLTPRSILESFERTEEKTQRSSRIVKCAPITVPRLMCFTESNSESSEAKKVKQSRFPAVSISAIQKTDLFKPPDNIRMAWIVGGRMYPVCKFNLVLWLLLTVPCRRHESCRLCNYSANGGRGTSPSGFSQKWPSGWFEHHSSRS